MPATTFACRRVSSPHNPLLTAQVWQACAGPEAAQPPLCTCPVCAARCSGGSAGGVAPKAGEQRLGRGGGKARAGLAVVHCFNGAATQLRPLSCVFAKHPSMAHFDGAAARLPAAWAVHKPVPPPASTAFLRCQS